MKRITLKTPPSPFVDNRVEKDIEKNKIFVNYTNFPDWVSNSNCLIQGSRGTGKTSILNIFNYKIRWFNNDVIYPSPIYQIYFPKEPDIIGVSYRCEEIEKNLWERWVKLKEVDECDIDCVFATYLNYYFINKIIEALHMIIECKKYKKMVKRKENISLFLLKIHNKCYPDHKKQPTLYDHSLMSLQLQLNETVEQIRHHIITLSSVENIYTFFNIHTSSSCILSEICELIQSHFKSFESVKFFIMFDDIDRLTEIQAKTIYTFVTSSKAPCSYKMTQTDKYTVNTNINGRSIGGSDLLITNLNDDREPTNKADKDEIDELFSAIFNTRISKIFKNSEVDLKTLLSSKIDIDKEVLITLKSSLNQKAINFIKEYENSETSKITDYWLFKNKIVDPSKRKDIDKHRVSAVFNLLSEYNFNTTFNYYSYDIIKMITSGSPRHFIRICHQMWDNIYYALSNCKYPIDNESQKLAITNASNVMYINYMNDPIPSRSVDKRKQVFISSICDRLAKLFKLLISVESLKISAECLSLQFDKKHLNADQENRLNDILDKLIMVEAIKIKAESKNRILIALTPMLAPLYNLPYRSPFSYSYALKDSSILIDLLSSEDEPKVERIIKSIYNDRINNNRTLFDKED